MAINFGKAMNVVDTAAKVTSQAIDTIRSNMEKSEVVDNIGGVSKERLQEIEDHAKQVLQSIKQSGNEDAIVVESTGVTEGSFERVESTGFKEGPLEKSELRSVADAFERIQNEYGERLNTIDHNFMSDLNSLISKVNMKIVQA